MIDPLAGVARYYTDKLRQHGAGPRGADWNSVESQRLRFVQLLRVIAGDGPFSLTDYGCGYGALLDELATEPRLTHYQGFDIVPGMLDEARRLHPGGTHTFVGDPQLLQPTDYVVASGIFNVKLDAEPEAWREHMAATMTHLAQLARVGFAFNVLTSYSDRDRQLPYLYYADPTWCFDHVKRHLAKNVSLLHDYPLWEFTILARK